MLHRGGVEVYTSNDFNYSAVKIYLSGQWKDAVPYLYTDGAWVKSCAAGTTMEQFITSTNDDFYTSNNEPFLVRKM